MTYPFQYKCLTTSCHTIKYSRKEIKDQPLYCAACTRKHQKIASMIYQENATKGVRSQALEVKNRDRARERAREMAAQDSRICVICQKTFSAKERHLHSKCCSSECQKIYKVRYQREKKEKIKALAFGGVAEYQPVSILETTASDGKALAFGGVAECQPNNPTPSHPVFQSKEVETSYWLSSAEKKLQNKLEKSKE